MKKVYFALITLALAAVSCDKRQPEDPNPLVAETGAQVYIDNATTTFYVKTAEEKAEKKESLAALTGKRFATLDTPADDSEIALPIIRKNATGEYDCEVDIYMGSNLSLFTVANISYEKDGVEVKEKVSLVTADFDEDKKEDGGSVKFTFPDEVAKVNVLIGFDIRNGLQANVDYKFEAWLGEEVESTAFGANDFSFIIKHSAPIHDPWVVIGSASNFQNLIFGSWGYSDLSPCTVTVAIHEHDFTDDSFIEKDGEKVINPDKTKRKLKDQAYYRFCIPSFGYQNVAASIEAGDGVFTEEDLEYFESSDGLMFFLEKETYDFIELRLDDRIYANPLADDITTGQKNSYQVPIWAYNHTTGKCDFNALNDGGLFTDPNPVHYLNPGYASDWTISHSAQEFSICVLEKYGTSLYYGDPISFKFDKNELEEDWDNYFKVNYDITSANCDINYIKSATGSVESEILGKTVPNSAVYEGYDVLYKNNVYSVYTGSYALAVLVGTDGKAKLAADQPFPGTAFGDKLFASQSDKYLSSVEFDDKGAIKTITLGVKIHYEGSDVAIKEFKEVFTADPATLTIDDFCGTYTQYSNLIEEDGTGIIPYMPINYYNSEVTISKISDTKAKISGIILSDFAAGIKGAADAYIEANFNPSTAMLEIPSQYVMSADGKDAVYYEEEGVKFFCYFKPGATYYSSDPSYGYFAYLDEPTSDIGLAFNDAGQLVLCPTKNTESVYAPDGYNIQFYIPDGQGGFAQDEMYYVELYCTFAQTALVPSGSASGIAPKADMQKKNPVSTPTKRPHTFKIKK